MKRLAVLLAVVIPCSAYADSIQVPHPKDQALLEESLIIPAERLGGVRTMSDVDVLPDGRIVILDADARRVALFASDGSFARWLAPPRGISPEATSIHRLVVLPDGGLVVADQEGFRFLFYGADLEPAEPVPFGREIVSINGFVRHPSGELYLVGYSIQDRSILHRFDAAGRHISSSVSPLDLAENQQGLSSGYLALDPADNSLWLSRLTPYEILHLSPEGEVLSTLARGAGEAPRPDRVGGFDYFRLNAYTTLRVAVLGDFIVNSYIAEGRKPVADVFTRDGTLVEAGLAASDPRSLAKRLANGMYMRHFNNERRVELWRKSP
ncbi:MAG: hypothetical protein ACREAA_18830 [Candidatus Polarisedimenticolia bacterium]